MYLQYIVDAAAVVQQRDTRLLPLLPILWPARMVVAPARERSTNASGLNEENTLIHGIHTRCYKDMKSGNYDNK